MRLREKRLIDIYILEILNEYSSEKQKMLQKDILYYLDVNYNIKVTRNTLSIYLQELKAYGYISGNRGVYIVRKFSRQDMRILMNNLLYSKSISQKNIQELLKKIKEFAEPDMRSRLNSLRFAADINRTDNDNINDIIDKLDKAIYARKRIEVTMCVYNIEGKFIRGKTYILDPYYIVVEKGRYYLICNAGRGDIEPRRIDRIMSIKILSEKRKEIREIEKYENGAFDLTKYINENIYMYSGESERIIIKVRINRIGDFIDWFGKHYRVMSKTDETVTVQIKANVNAVYFWALQYSAVAEILKPDSLREKIKKGAKRIWEMYQ